MITFNIIINVGGRDDTIPIKQPHQANDTNEAMKLVYNCTVGLKQQQKPVLSGAKGLFILLSSTYRKYWSYTKVEVDM